jgi:hypothetical protein
VPENGTVIVIEPGDPDMTAVISAAPQLLATVDVARDVYVCEPPDAAPMTQLESAASTLTRTTSPLDGVNDGVTSDVVSAAAESTS